MLILKNVDKKTAGTWCDFPFLGQTLSVKIRPFTAEIAEDLQKKHPEPAAYAQALADHLLESFSGVVDEDRNPLQVTPENKKRLLEELPALDGNLSLQAFVFDKARRLAFDILEEEKGNS